MDQKTTVSLGDFEEFFQDQKIGVRPDEYEPYDSSGAEAYIIKNKAYHFSSYLKHDVALPGHLLAKRESCRKWKLLACKHGDHAQIQKTEMTCNNKNCNACFDQWLSTEANKIALRLYGYCTLKRNNFVYKEKIRSRKPAHLVVSARFEDYKQYETREGRKEQRTKIFKILKKYGLDIDGGVMIDHIYRFTVGLEKAYWSPHHHILYTGWIDGNIVKEIYNETGLIIKQIATTDDWIALRNQAKYLLTHSACYQKEEGKRSAEHSVRYFGDLNNRKLKVESLNKYSIDAIDSIEKEFGKIEEEQMIKGKGIKSIGYNLIRSPEIKATTFSDHTKFDIDGDIEKLYELRDLLKEYIEPKTEATYLEDNPAYSQSDQADIIEVAEAEFEPFMAIELRVDYYDIVQSVYHVFVFEFDDSRLCCKCSRFLRHHCIAEHGDHRRWQLLLSELPDGIQMTVLDENNDLERPSWELEGMPYLTEEMTQKYDQGLYEKPPVEIVFNEHMQYRIDRFYEIQKARIVLKERNGHQPTYDEIVQYIGQQDTVLLHTLDGMTITQTEQKRIKELGIDPFSTYTE